MRIRFILNNVKLNELGHHPWSTEKETLEFITNLAKLIDAQIILEIGTFTGYTTLHLLKGLNKDGKIYTIDKTDTFTRNYANLPKSLKHKITFIHKDSSQAFDLINKHQVFDLIYIDADHKFSNCIHDFYKSLIHSKINTVILLHDSMSHSHPGVALTIKFVRAINLIFLGRLFDIVNIKTLPKEDGNISGLCIVKVKFNNFLIKNLMKNYFFWSRKIFLYVFTDI